MKNILTGCVVLLTGGSGSFGRAFCKEALKYNPKTIRVFSRSEEPQRAMKEEFNRDDRLTFLLGDIRDRHRIYRACDGVDIIVHAAAVKQIPHAAYNPFECSTININGSMNVIDAAIDHGVKNVIAISSDKACYAATLYGGTKFVMESLVIQGNSYVGQRKTKLSCVRYGNCIGSRGSVFPVFKEQIKEGCLQITDKRMTRFTLTLTQGVRFVMDCLGRQQGGEVFIPRLPSANILDIAQAVWGEYMPSRKRLKIKIIGIRVGGEKLHEVLVTEDEARYAKDHGDFLLIEPQFPFWQVKTDGKPLPEGFSYTSLNNPWKLSVDEIRGMLK